MAGVKSIKKPDLMMLFPTVTWLVSLTGPGGGVIQRGDLALQIGDAGLDLLCMSQ